MSIQHFFVDTIVLLHVTTHDEWADPFIETYVYSGRLEESHALYVSEVEGLKSSAAMLFLPPGTVAAAEDYVVVGGVKYQLKNARPIKNRAGIHHHTECDLGSGIASSD